MNYKNLSQKAKEELFLKVQAEYDALKKMGLSLDMSRGKPSFSQVDVSNDFFDLVNAKNGFLTKDGIDCRNYGIVDGIAEAKSLFAKILKVPVSNVICGGNSSLNMMFDCISQAFTHGFGGKPWAKQGKIKFLCPVPGYDRHFGICEHFGIEMIPIKMNADGPDMDLVEKLVKDKHVKGIWSIPKYSNPEGMVYSDEVVRRFANLKPKAKDFRIFWDNAYAVHNIGGDTSLLSLFDECKKAGNENLALQFTSTSKITFPGGGVAALAAGDEDIKRIKQRMNYQTIGPDKLNQLRHTKMFPNITVLKEHMKKHAAALRPKFEIVLKSFDSELKGIATWTKPKGGYFISLYVEEGLAKRVHTLCKDAGLILTGAGATYPYGKDPKDSNLRIAPSFPPEKELQQACKVLCAAVKLATLEKLLNQ